MKKGKSKPVKIVNRSGSRGSLLSGKKKIIDIRKMPDAQVRALAAELIVHQIELEKQAKELKNYEILFSEVTDLLYICDDKGKILFVNSVFQKLTGYRPAEFIGKSFKPLFDKENRNKALDVYTRTLYGESPRYELCFKDTGVVCEFKNIPWRDGKGNIVGVLGAARDVSERKRMEQLQSRFIAILEATTDFVGFADAKTSQILFINKAGRKMVGVGDSEDVTRLKIADVHPESTNKLFLNEGFPAVIRDGVWHGECAFQSLDGRTIPVMMVLMAHKNAKGEAETFSTISRDISERICIEEELKTASKALEALVEERTTALVKANKELLLLTENLRNSETRLRTIIDNMFDGIVVFNEKGLIVSFNPMAVRIFGYTAIEAAWQKIDMLLANPFFLEEDEIIYRHLKSGAIKTINNGFEMKGRRKDGSIFILEILVSELWGNILPKESNLPINTEPVIWDEEHEYICAVRDISERKASVAEIRKLSAVIGQSVNIIFITDKKGRIEYVNPMFEQITGYSKEEVIGQTPAVLDSGETAYVVIEEMLKTVTTGKTWRGTNKNKRKDGQCYWCDSIITPICDEQGQVTHFLLIQEDITEKMKLKEDANLLTAYASFDGLTGLYNRTRFMELLDGWIVQAKACNYTGAILLIDIDKFRMINDTYGSKVGDELLKRMAEYLKGIISDMDMQYFVASNKEIMESLLCRMGGDEFAVFLPSRAEKEALETADEIRRRLESFQFENWAGHITISVGIVLYPAHGDTLYDLFKKVDAAVFSAKEQGRNRSRLYKAEDLVLEKMYNRVEWKGRIQKAIKEDRIVPWFQPIFDLKTETIYHYEVLVRIQDGGGGFIQPGEFIDTAEAFGLIRDIDRIVVEKTLKFKKKLLKEGKPFHFSMNLSAKDLEDKGFMEFLKSIISEVSANAERLIFEITETAAVHDLARVVGFIRELKSIGCKFSLDDFGVGFTSFRYLSEMEVDYIKIDGMFIRKLTESKNDRLFVKSMVDVAHGMGIKTVAEFVENKETVAILRELGVDYAQGYFIGKPAQDVLKEDYKPQ